ncbi:MAG: O-antigen ligase family protein [Desulfobacterales bacterium]|nr:O-antigen ligase family protein [Desulfobacterales bacterium]
MIANNTRTNFKRLPVGDRTLFFLFAHIPLAYLVNKSAYAATAYALFLLFLGLSYLSKRSNEFKFICLVSYMSSAEVLWRMGHAKVFWEYGKYGIGFLLVFALLKTKRIKRSDQKALIYFLLLIPSIFVMPYFDRELISFNLSGPFLLSLAVLYFSTVKFNQHQTVILLTALLAPLIGAAFLATSGTMALGHVTITESSKLTSAGYGPNQMSSMLGLGALVAFLLTLMTKEKRTFSILMACICIWMLTQCALTFSRGGFWSAIGAMAILSFYLLQSRKYKKYLLVTLALSLIVIQLVVLPGIEQLTQGSVSSRMQSTDLTGRDKIIRSEWAVFKDNPIFGVGPGMAYDLRALYFKASHAHTEYTRLLAEHGIFGALAIILLFFIILKNFSKGGVFGRALSLSFQFWAMIFMLHAAMRLAACPFVFGLGTAIFAGEIYLQSQNRSLKPHLA